MINSSEIPQGRISRRLEADLMTETLPAYLSSYGDTPTFTNHPLTANRGAFEMTVTNGFAFLQFPQVDISQFEEIRLGAAFRTNISGGDSIALSYDASGINESGDRLTVFSNAIDSAIRVSEVAGGINDTYATTPPSPGTYQTVREVVLRPQADEYDICLDDQVAYRRGYTNFNDTLAYYPKLQLYTGSTGTEGSAFVHKVWLELDHN